MTSLNSTPESDIPVIEVSDTVLLADQPFGHQSLYKYTSVPHNIVDGVWGGAMISDNSGYKFPPTVIYGDKHNPYSMENKTVLCWFRPQYDNTSITNHSIAELWGDWGLEFEYQSGHWLVASHAVVADSQNRHIANERLMLAAKLGRNRVDNSVNQYSVFNADSASNVTSVNIGGERGWPESVFLVFLYFTSTDGQYRIIETTGGKWAEVTKQTSANGSLVVLAGQQFNFNNNDANYYSSLTVEFPTQQTEVIYQAVVVGDADLETIVSAKGSVADAAFPASITLDKTPDSSNAYTFCAFACPVASDPAISGATSEGSATTASRRLKLFSRSGTSDPTITATDASPNWSLGVAVEIPFGYEIDDGGTNTVPMTAYFSKQSIKPYLSLISQSATVFYDFDDVASFGVYTRPIQSRINSWQPSIYGTAAERAEGYNGGGALRTIDPTTVVPMIQTAITNWSLSCVFKVASGLSTTPYIIDDNSNLYRIWVEDRSNGYYEIGLTGGTYFGQLKPDTWYYLIFSSTHPGWDAWLMELPADQYIRESDITRDPCYFYGTVGWAAWANFGRVAYNNDGSLYLDDLSLWHTTDVFADNNYLEDLIDSMRGHTVVQSTDVTAIRPRPIKQLDFKDTDNIVDKFVIFDRQLTDEEIIYLSKTYSYPHEASFIADFETAAAKYLGFQAYKTNYDAGQVVKETDTLTVTSETSEGGTSKWGTEEGGGE